MTMIDTITKPIHPDFLELQEYFGSDFNLDWCTPLDEKEVAEAARYTNNAELILKSPIFVYQSIALPTQGISRPYIAKLLQLTADQFMPSVLDYGSGGGQIGLALHTLGYRVSFADVMSQSLMFLVWRLRQRKLSLPVYEIGKADIPRHDLAICFDVIEHQENTEAQIEIIDNLGRLAGVSFVNLVLNTGVELPKFHFPIDHEALINHIAMKWNHYIFDYYPDENGRTRQKLLVFGDEFVE